MKKLIDITIVIQVGVGVAVVVFGLVFTLGDFVPSGRYACKYKV